MPFAPSPAAAEAYRRNFAQIEDAIAREQARRLAEAAKEKRT